MKRFTCAALAALALLTAAASPTARADAFADFAGLTLEELYEARVQLNARIEALEAEGGLRSYESGGYLVGRDIPAGDYVLYENSDAVFASAVVRAGDSEESDLVNYHLVNGRAAIRLKADTWLTLSEATACPLSQAARVEGDVVVEGGYLVGAMLPPGQYTAAPAEKAPLSSYSIHSGILDTNARLLKFELLHEDTPVTLAEGEYVELSGCVLRPVTGGEEE